MIAGHRVSAAPSIVPLIVPFRALVVPHAAALPLRLLRAQNR